jgi:hypothetical protein
MACLHPAALQPHRRPSALTGPVGAQCRPARPRRRPAPPSAPSAPTQRAQPHLRLAAQRPHDDGGVLAAGQQQVGARRVHIQVAYLAGVAQQVLERGVWGVCGVWVWVWCVCGVCVVCVWCVGVWCGVWVCGVWECGVCGGGGGGGEGAGQGARQGVHGQQPAAASAVLVSCRGAPQGEAELPAAAATAAAAAAAAAPPTQCLLAVARFHALMTPLRPATTSSGAPLASCRLHLTM